MTDRQLMQQALDALELLAWYENPATKVQVRKPRNGGPIVTMYPHKVATEAAAPLRERLAQPEQEPVATVRCINGITIGYLEVMQPVGTKLYTTPPQGIYYTPTQRKPLTDAVLAEREACAAMLDANAMACENPIYRSLLQANAQAIRKMGQP